MKIVKQFQLKFVILTAVKNRCMLHGPVFVMPSICSLFYCVCSEGFHIPLGAWDRLCLLIVALPGSPFHIVFQNIHVSKYQCRKGKVMQGPIKKRKACDDDET